MLWSTLLGHLLLAWLTSTMVDSAAPSDQTKLGCQDKCGNISIPYPFGLGDDPNCFEEPKFQLYCNTTFDPPLLFMKGDMSTPIINISLQGQITILLWASSQCHTINGTITGDPFYLWLRLTDYKVSDTRNKFVAIGCDTQASMMDSSGKNFQSGCISYCTNVKSVINGSCTGIGCCQTAVPKGIDSIDMKLQTYNNHKYSWNFSRCSYAFLADDQWFKFYLSDLMDFPERIEYKYKNLPAPPVVLDWAIGNITCNEAVLEGNLNGYVCGRNTNCSDSENGPGYHCHCKEGFEGNPYLLSGCKGIGSGILFLLIGSSWIYWGVKKRKLIKLKEKFFQQNGGLFLQRQLSSLEYSVETTKIFTSEELKKATDNYNEQHILGRGGYGTVYKGILSDERIVAIKKSKVIDKEQIEQFINEVLILSQINHRNVVKLLGCCLETEVPLLAYEYITNGTLHHHIHDQKRKCSLSWSTRLRIATETAEALAYLHSAASQPIIHRDVKSTNILLDDNYTAKVSDFGASRMVALDETQLSTLVQGTMGYLDPEYLQTSLLTDRSDVYSFGVVLVELLTRKKVLSFEKPEEQRNLAMYFVSSMKENRLIELLDQEVVKEGDLEEIQEVASLARRCLRLNGEERPTMKEVAMELEGLRVSQKHVWTEKNPEETTHLLGQSSFAIQEMNPSYDSITQVTTSFDIGR